MKTNFLSLIFVALFFVSCSSVSYLDNKDSRSLTSVGIDYHDIEAVASQSIKSMLSSRYVQNMDSSTPKILAISDVVNDTMQLVDVQSLTGAITRAISNSGKFRVTVAVGGNASMSDRLISKSRGSRDDAEFNQNTTIEKGSLLSPDFSLSGKIVQRNVTVGSKQRIDYNFILVLTDLRSGIVEWSDESHIIKTSRGRSW